MTPSSRLLRTLTALLVLVAIALPGAARVSANGLGDLYVGVPEGVKELYLREEKDLFTVDLAFEPVTLAFSNDGTSLYTGDGRTDLVRIDITGPNLAQEYAPTTDVAALAYPKGNRLFLAAPKEKALLILADGDDEPVKGPALHGAADLLAFDHRSAYIVAAERGEGWLDVVDTTQGEVSKVDIGGKIVAVSVAADEGVAFVATTAPDTVQAVSLESGKVAWKATLAAEPSSVTWAGEEAPRMAIVAQGDTLVRAQDGATATWVRLEDDASLLATSDEGAYVYASVPAGVTAISVENPQSPPPAEVALDDAPAALAPVPKASSLSSSGTSETSGNGGETGNGSGGENGNEASPTKAPATDAEDQGGPRFQRPGPDPLLLVGGAAIIALIVVAGTRSVIATLTKDA